MIFWKSHPRWVLGILAVIFLVPGTWSLPLVDRDEPRFSRATVEMAERENWIVPYFNDHYRFDKPPLTYWWMGVHYGLWGTHEIAARTHSMLAAFLISLLVFGFSRRIGLTTEWALLSGIIWLGSLQVFIHGRVAVADMPLILGIVLCLRAIWEYLIGEVPLKTGSRYFWLLTLGLAFGFLAKGPLALLVPGLTCIGFWLLVRGAGTVESVRWRRLMMDSLGALAISALIVGAWGIPALLQTKGAYFDVGIGEHVIERGVSSFNDRFYLPGVYYFIVVLVFFSPWVATLWPSVREGFRERRNDPTKAFLLAWAVSPVVIFAFYKTQLPHYVLPGYPALAILCAGWLAGSAKPRWQLSLWFTRIILTVLTAFGFILTVALLGSAITGRLWVATLGLTIAFGALLAGGEWVRMRKWGRVVTMLCLVGLSFLLIGAGVRPEHVVLKTVERLGGGAEKLVSSGYTEPSLVFYAKHPWIFVDSAEEGMDLVQGEDGVLLLASRVWRLDKDTIASWLSGESYVPALDHRPKWEDSVNLEQIEWVQGFSPGTFAWVELGIYRYLQNDGDD